MESSKKSNNNMLLESCKWIGLTAVGVVVGMTVYNTFVKKLLFKSEKNDVVNIIDANDRWEIPVIACNENGESFITKEYFQLNDKGDIGKLSNEIPVKSLKFRTTPSDYFYDWHTAPKTQFIINLDAPVRVTTTDKNSILLKTGQVFIVRDISGKGHYSQSVNNLARKSIFIAIQE